MILSLFSPWLWLTLLVSVWYHPHFQALKNSSSKSHRPTDIFLDATELLIRNICDYLEEASMFLEYSPVSGHTISLDVNCE